MKITDFTLTLVIALAIISAVDSWLLFAHMQHDHTPATNVAADN